MANTYKICPVCGKEFKVCNTCHGNIPEDKQWHRVVCSFNHFYYHLPIIYYVRGRYTKEQAREKLLEAIKLFGDIELYGEYKVIAEDIFSEDKSVVKVTDDTQRDEVDNEPVLLTKQTAKKNKK